MKYPTICVKCKFCKTEIVHTSVYHYCMVSDRKFDPAINYVTGENGYLDYSNDQFTDRKYPKCCQVNDGYCNYFKKPKKK